MLDGQTKEVQEGKGLSLPEEYTSRCRLCWPQKEGDQSSSDSEDEVSEGGAVEPPLGDILYSPEDRESGDLW